MRDKLKLRHVDVLAEMGDDKKELLLLMLDVFGYKNTFFGRSRMYLNCLFKPSILTQDITSIDYKDMELNEDSHIVKPENIDSISYLAMLDLNGIYSSGSRENLSLYIANINAIATYEGNRISKYSMNSKSFKRYRDNLLELNLFDMMGLYNWVVDSLEESSNNWNERFLSVEVVDKNLASVGGDALHQFNVINTIKSICNDFNVSEKEAWHISYNLAMTNSYSKAYEGYLQDQIRIKQEAKMKAQNR